MLVGQKGYIIWLMSEVNLPHYDRARFPYAGILQDLTEQIRTAGYEPFEAYEKFLNARDNEKLRPYFDYASTSITTGGHARREDLDMRTVIAKNTKTARDILNLLDAQGTLLGREVVLPVDLGKVGWGQSDFMAYWGLTLAGPDLRKLPNVQRIHADSEFNIFMRREGVDIDLMNSNMSRDERRPEYMKFVRALAEFVGKLETTSMPAHRLISLVDTSISLGCEAEKELAKTLKIPTQQIVPVKPALVDEAVPVPTVREDLKIITALGGTVCVAAKGSMLTLVSHDAATPVLT